MDKIQQRLNAAFPDLISKTARTIAPARTRASLARLHRQYIEDCAAAMNILFNHCHAVPAGEAVVLVGALPAAQFDRIAALGAALEDLECDDPPEDGGDAEPEEDDDDRIDEEDGRELGSSFPQKEAQ